MNINKKILICISALLSIVLISAGISLAILKENTNKVSNKFIYHQINCEIQEDITTTPGVKKNVKVKNTGDVDSYIRACVVINWVDEDGNVYNSAPVAGVDYTIVQPDPSSWFNVGDIYYCKTPVAADASSPVLITSITPVSEKVPEGYVLSVDIIGNSVSCNDVGTAWGVTVAPDGTISFNS